jgi:hypothetical protein
VKLVVSGSRGLYSRKIEDLIEQTINKLKEKFKIEIKEIVHGDCRKSPDQSAHDYCIRTGMKETKFPADWNGPLKKGAGFKRNVDMAEYGDILLSIMKHGGTNGSKHMVEVMRINKKRVILLIYHPDTEMLD